MTCPRTPCPRPATGSPPSPLMPSRRTYHPDSPMPEDNWNPEPRRTLFTGNVSLSATGNDALDGSGIRLDRITSSQPGQVPHSNTSGRMTPEWEEHNSSSANSQSTAPPQMTGSVSGNPPNVMTWTEYPVMCEFGVIINCAELQRIIANRLLCGELPLFTGARLKLANLVGQHKKPVMAIMLKIRVPNGLVDTAVSQLQSLTNSEEVLMSRIYSDGSIGIRFLLKPKGGLCRCVSDTGSSLPTFIPATGTRTWTQTHFER